VPAEAAPQASKRHRSGVALRYSALRAERLKGDGRGL